MPDKVVSKDELQKILQVGTVDVGNDTLFSRVQKLKVSKDRLTLVISSGGSGASAIKEAIATAKQKLERAFSVYMKFIMLDAATRELNAAGNALGRQQLQVLNISTPGASERLRPENRDDFYKKFVPAGYDYMQLNPDGSGRDRLTGKIKFYDNAENGGFNDTKFREMISAFYAEGGDWSDKKTLPVDIMILAGLSGGNGSGTFQELAAHARYVCKHAGAQEVRVFGYLFLPDTVESFEKDPDIKSTLYTNGYAALKELESYMSIPFNPEREEPFCARETGVDDISSTINNPLFDYPVLISGGYNETKSMMAESIINLTVASDGSFDQNSFYSNTGKVRKAHLGAPSCLKGGLLKPDEFPEDSRRYAGIGYAYAAIPNEIVTANVVSNVSEKLYEESEAPDGSKPRFCKEESRMNRFEMETQIRKLFAFGDKEKLTTRIFWDQKVAGALKKASTLIKNDAEINRKEIKSGKIEHYEKGFHKEARIIDGTKKFQAHLSELYRIFESNAMQVIRDYGPRAIEYVFTGKGPDDKDGKPLYFTDICINSMLEEAKNQFNKILSENRARPDNDIPGGLGEVLLKKHINNWKNGFHSALEYETKQTIVRNVTGSEGAWEKTIMNQFDQFVKKCQCFAERLEMLTDFYHSAGSPLDDSNYARFLAASQEGNCVNLCNNGEVYDWVKQEVSKKINSVNTAVVKQGLVDSFTNNADLWTSDTEGVTRKEFDNVMSTCCGLGKGAGANGSTISLSARSYFDHVLDQVDKSQVNDKAEQLVKGIIDGLLEKSKPSLKKSGGFCAVNRFVIIPETLQLSPYGKPIENAFRAAVTAEGLGTAQVAVSGSVNEVVCYQTSVANALYDLTELPKWESHYNTTSSVSRHSVSRHLNNGEFGGSYVERTKSQIETEKAVKEGRKAPDLKLSKQEDILFGTGLSWEHYPPLALKQLGNNEKEREFQETIFDPIVRYAMKEKIIQRKNPAGNNPDVYQYVLNVIPASWKSLDVSDYDEMGLDGRLARGEDLFRYLSDQNIRANTTWQKVIQLSDSGYFEGSYDFTVARTFGNGLPAEVIEDYSILYMKRILRKNTKLFLELRETLCRYYEIAKELEAKDSLYLQVYQVKKFAEYYKFGIVTEDAENEKWYFLDVKGKRQVLSGFTPLERQSYNNLELKLLNDDWKFLLALHDFTKLNDLTLTNFATIKNNMIQNMASNKLNDLIVQKEDELGIMKDRIRQEILNKFPNRTPQDAVRTAFDLNKGEGVFYLKAVDAILEYWPDKKDTPPKSSWICPSCGRENDDDIMFCPKCGTKKPSKEEPVKSGWFCPSCGRKNEDDIMFCPKCGTKNPGAEPPKTTWICPVCSREYEKDVKFCPEDGTKQP